MSNQRNFRIDPLAKESAIFLANLPTCLNTTWMEEDSFDVGKNIKWSFHRPKPDEILAIVSEELLFTTNFS